MRVFVLGLVALGGTALVMFVATLLWFTFFVENLPCCPDGTW